MIKTLKLKIKQSDIDTVLSNIYLLEDQGWKVYASSDLKKVHIEREFKIIPSVSPTLEIDPETGALIISKLPF